MNNMSNQQEINKNVFYYLSEQLDTERFGASTGKNILLNFEQDPNLDTQEKQNESQLLQNEFQEMEKQNHFYDISSFNQVFSLNFNNSDDPEILSPEQSKPIEYNEFLNGCQNIYMPVQQNVSTLENALNHIPSAYPQIIREVQPSINQESTQTFEKKFLDFQETSYNFQEDIQYQQLHQFGGQSWLSIQGEAQDEPSSVSQNTILPKKAKQPRQKNKSNKTKHRLDGKLVNKLKNFYRNIMGRIRNAFIPLYEDNERMLQLIDSLCLESNQRNFLKLFPQMKEESSSANKEMALDREEDDPSYDNEDRVLLNELRMRAKVFFGRHFLRMVSLYKSKNSVQNKEEYLYGCLFYAERSAKKSLLLTSENRAIQHTKFNFNFEQTVFPDEILSSDDQIIVSDSELPQQQSLNYSLHYNPCYQISMSPQYSQNINSPVTYQHDDGSLFSHHN